MSQTSPPGLLAPQHRSSHHATEHAAAYDAGARPGTAADNAVGSPGDNPRKVLGVVLGLVALLAVVLLAFGLPAVHSGSPHNLPVGVVGTATAAARVAQADDGLKVTRFGSEAEARQAILRRDIDGAFVIASDGSVHTMAASAGSTSVAALLEQVGTSLAGSSSVATVTDVRSFPADDSRGLGLSAGALPMALGGWIGAVVILMLVRTPRQQVAAAAAFAITGGLALTAVFQYALGTLDGNYLLTSLGAILGIAATAAIVLGLRTALGPRGLGIAAVLLILLGNPLSGLTSAPELLPTPWGSLGQLLPPGATGTLLRDLAFFDGHGMTSAAVVLTCWLLGGAALFAYAVRRNRSRVGGEQIENQTQNPTIERQTAGANA